MLYRTLLKLKKRNGLTDDLKNKIDTFFCPPYSFIIAKKISVSPRRQRAYFSHDF